MEDQGIWHWRVEMGIPRMWLGEILGQQLDSEAKIAIWREEDGPKEGCLQGKKKKKKDAERSPDSGDQIKRYCIVQIENLGEELTIDA